MNNYFSTIKPVLNKLTELNIFVSLDVVRKYVYYTIYRKGIENIRGIECPQKGVVEIYIADFLIKNLIIYSSIAREKKSFTEVKTREAILSPIYELQRTVNEKRMEEYPTIWVSSYFFNQINMQPEGNERILFYRYYFIYNEPQVLLKIEESLGFPLLNYFRMLFLLYSGYANHFYYPIDQLFNFFSNDSLDLVALKYILSIISKPLTELKELCKNDDRYDEDQIMGYYADSPHVKYPLIEFEQKLYCVIPAFILLASFDHLYHILNEKDQETRTKFAVNFERYIGKIIESHFSNTGTKKIKYKTEIKYKFQKKEKKTSDWIIWDETDICFIECKIKKVTIIGQKANNIDVDLINRILNEKPFSNSNRKKISDLPEGLTKDIINYGIDLGKIFVCYDDYVENHIKEFLYMPGKRFHAFLLTLEQNFNNAYEIRNEIIKIAQCYRNYMAKNSRIISDDEVIILSSRDIERQIPIIAEKGIAEYMNIREQGDLYKYEVNSEYLSNQCKKVLLDDLLKDINDMVKNESN